MDAKGFGWAQSALCLLTAAGTLCVQGCQHQMSPPKRDINAVLADHDDRLLAIPGVVGVYIGLQNETECLKVMLTRTTARTKRLIPRTLEGYPVIQEVTGEVHPFKEP